MKIINELREYRDNVFKIKKIEQDIEEMKESFVELTGPVYDSIGGRPTGFMESSLENRIIKLQMNIEKKKNAIKKIQKKLNIIDSLIMSLSSEEKIIIGGFYLEGKTNKKVAREIDNFREVVQENEKTTVEAIKKRKGRIVNKMQNKYDFKIKK